MRTAPEFTINEMLEWANSKPADMEYEYMSNTNCALAQFLKETGRAYSPGVIPLTQPDGGGSWYEKSDELYDSHPYSPELEKAISNDNDISNKEDMTFGALAKRLEAII